MSQRHMVVASTTVAAPVEVVWAHLCDTRRFDEWVESTLEVLDADVPLRLGAVYEERTRLSGLWTARTRWEVVEFDPPNHLAFEGTGVRALQALRVDFDAIPVGPRTEVSSTYAYTWGLSLLGSVLEFLAKNNVTAEQKRTLRTLSILAERSHGGS